MSRSPLPAALFLSASLLFGCATTGGTRSSNNSAPAPAVESEITSLTTGFIDAVMDARYDAVTPMVLPSQALGFEPRAFVEERFRRKLGSFQILVYDKQRVAVTAVKNSSDMLSSSVVHARILAGNEVLPIVVNLRCRRSSSRWYIVPFPEASPK